MGRGLDGSGGEGTEEEGEEMVVRKINEIMLIK